MRRGRLVVLISGSGSNLQALLDACANGTLAAEIVAVVSNRRDAFGLVRAQQAGVTTEYLPLWKFTEAGRSRVEYDASLAEIVSSYQPDWVVCAGWMQIFTPVFIEQFANCLVNLHPALPGQFPGAHAIDDAFAAFQRGEIQHSGAMIHFVVPEIDAGPVIDTIETPIFATDTLETFAERMHTHEHLLIVRAMQKLISNMHTINEKEG